MEDCCHPWPGEARGEISLPRVQDGSLRGPTVGGEQEPVSWYSQVMATAAVAVTTVYVADVSATADVVTFLGAATLCGTGEAFRKRLLLALPLPGPLTVLPLAGPKCKPEGKGS